MTILVTGGTGFAGSHLVRQLLEKGHGVRVLDKQEGLNHSELHERGATITLGSVTDEALVSQLIEGCEVVYHLAAAFRQLNVPKQHYWNVNVEGTRIVAAAALRHGVRKLVYCSTCGVHGNIASPPGNEEAPIAPEDYYQYTKYKGEEVVQQFVAQGLDAVILRPAAMYGPGDPERFLHLFRHTRRGRFLMFGDGSTFYHPLHVANLTAAFESAGDISGRSGQSYLIADDKYWSLNDLVGHVGQAMNLSIKIVHLPYWPLWSGAAACELACKPFGISPPLFRRRVAWFRQNRAFSIEKARRDLGYNPTVGLPEGLAQTAKWYFENNYL